MDQMVQSFHTVKQRYMQWWNQCGFLTNISILRDSAVGKEYDNDNWKASATDEFYYKRFHTDPAFNLRENLAKVQSSVYLGDTIPIAMMDYHTISMAAYLGAQVEFGTDTVWYHPNPNGVDQVLAFDANNIWWQNGQRIIAALKSHEDAFFIGATAPSAGLDTLYALCGAEDLMVALVHEPHWVLEKLQEIQQAYFTAYDQICAQLTRADGSMVFGYFSLWGQGSTTQVQCDISALISPQMFERFELPFLAERCAHYDNTMYHLDGTQAMVHLDALLQLDALNAIEWSPQAGIETGGNARWYPLYEKILKSGKALQVVEATADETVELARMFGKSGVNVMTQPMAESCAQDMLEQIEKYI